MMRLSGKFITSVINGWLFCGVISTFVASKYIAGAATLFALLAFGSLTLFSDGKKQSPSFIVSLIIVLLSMALVLIIFSSGFFNFV